MSRTAEFYIQFPEIVAHPPVWIPVGINLDYFPVVILVVKSSFECDAYTGLIIIAIRVNSTMHEDRVRTPDNRLMLFISDLVQLFGVEQIRANYYC